MSSQKKPQPEPKTDLSDEDKSIIVVADTHFGLRKESEHSDPNAFSDFLTWLKSLEANGAQEVKAGIWSSAQDGGITVRPPEKIVFLGDILELWDASKQAIDACTRSIFQSLSMMEAKKIYVLGNHDAELAQLAGDYPLGLSSLHLQEGAYSISKGDKNLVFLHGHEFDKLFALPSWRIMPLINHAATVFGSYTWLFVFFLGLDLPLLFWRGFSNVADWIILLVLGAVSVPFLVTKFGRNVWNKLKSTKYKPQDAEVGLQKWWSPFTGKSDSGNWNIVYGHTHVIGFWSTKLGNAALTMFNLPSWVKDVGQKGEVSLDMVFRHGFLYIDKESIEFFGWDTEKKKPFLVPKDVIQTRLQNGDATRVGYDVETELKAIGWPQKLIDKWLGYSFKDKALA
jgi:UDP-2,3-diacylglucosamine pyrophosphatase LpxH